MPSILTPDPSSATAQSLVLHGRTLDVVRAVTRDEATRLKAEGEKARADRGPGGGEASAAVLRRAR